MQEYGLYVQGLTWAAIYWKTEHVCCFTILSKLLKLNADSGFSLFLDPAVLHLVSGDTNHTTLQLAPSITTINRSKGNEAHDLDKQQILYIG